MSGVPSYKYPIRVMKQSDATPAAKTLAEAKTSQSTPGGAPVSKTIVKTNFSQPDAKTSNVQKTVQGNNDSVSQAQMHANSVKDNDNTIPLRFDNGIFAIDSNSTIAIPFHKTVTVKGDASGAQGFTLMTGDEVRKLYEVGIQRANQLLYADAYGGLNPAYFKNGNGNLRLYPTGFADLELSAGYYPNPVGIRFESSAHPEAKIDGKIPYINPIYSSDSKGNYVVISNPHNRSQGGKMSHDFAPAYKNNVLAHMLAGDDFHELKAKEVMEKGQFQPLYIGNSIPAARISKEGKFMSIAGHHAIPPHEYDTYMSTDAAHEDNKIMISKTHSDKICSTMSSFVATIPDVGLEKHGAAFSAEPLNESKMWNDFGTKGSDLFQKGSDIDLIFSGNLIVSLGKKTGEAQEIRIARGNGTAA